MLVDYNPNPAGRRVSDCTVRAICKAMGQNWEQTFVGLCAMGLEMHDMPNANVVWGQYLRENGFERRPVKADCPVCYTVADFAREFPQGTYIVAVESHVVCVCDGDIYDSWDSSDLTPIYYWEKKEDNEIV